MLFVDFNDDEKNLIKKTVEENIEFKTIKNHLTGPINLFMDLIEIKSVLSYEFNTRFRNCFLTTDDLNNNNYLYLRKPHHDMNRIYGAQYINEMYKLGKTKFRAPKGFIVLQNPEQLRVKLKYFNETHVSIELINANIYFQKINGKGVADVYKNDLFEQLHYRDSTDPNNLIEERETKELYIVDTELKSFTDGNYNKILGFTFSTHKEIVNYFHLYCQVLNELYHRKDFFLNIDLHF